MKFNYILRNMHRHGSVVFLAILFMTIRLCASAYSQTPTATPKGMLGAGKGGAGVYLIIERKWNGNWYPVTGQDKTVWVSQRIHLQARMSDGSKLYNQSWSVPGDAFYSYSQTVNSTQVQSLSSSLLKKDAVSFVWRDRGENLNVEFSGIANGRSVGPKGVKFKVKKPPFRMSAKIDGVNWSAKPNEPSNPWLRLGDFSKIGSTPLNSVSVPPRGIVIMANKDGEWPAGGVLMFVQVVQLFKRKLYDSPTGGITLARTSGLDSKKGSPNVRYPFTPTVTGVDYAMQDSPGQAPISSTQVITCEDIFATWLMFKTNNQDSQWVPLRKLTWQWGGQMNRNPNGSWPTTPVGGYGTANSSSETTELPKWTNNLQPFKWVKF